MTIETLEAHEGGAISLQNDLPDNWPIEARISHRILIYAAERRPRVMNQSTIEEIVREELSKGAE